MTKLLVQYNEDFGRMGNLEGLFICTDEELETINGVEVYFGEVLGKNSEVYSDETYEYCTVISEDMDLIRDLESLFKYLTLSGYNPLDYLPEEDYE